MSNVLAICQTIETMQPKFAASLPAHIKPERFARVAINAVQNNPRLAELDRASVYGSCMKAAQMGLIPDGREGAIVEFKGKAQFMVMIAGVLRLIRNSGEVSTIDAIVVCRNDKFTYRPGLDEVPVHEPDWFGERGDMIGVYAVARLREGGAMVEIMSMREIEKIRAASRSGSNGPWVSWFEEMAKKSVLRRLSKRLPLSTDIDEAFDDEPNATPATQTQAEEHAPTDPPKPRRSRLSAVVTDAVVDVDDAPPPAPKPDLDPPI